jgi:hypothetical protein
MRSIGSDKGEEQLEPSSKQMRHELNHSKQNDVLMQESNGILPLTEEAPEGPDSQTRKSETNINTTPISKTDKQCMCFLTKQQNNKKTYMLPDVTINNDKLNKNKYPQQKIINPHKHTNSHKKISPDDLINSHESSLPMTYLNNKTITSNMPIPIKDDDVITISSLSSTETEQDIICENSQQANPQPSHKIVNKTRNKINIKETMTHQKRKRTPYNSSHTKVSPCHLPVQ